MFADDRPLFFMFDGNDTLHQNLLQMNKWYFSMSFNIDPNKQFQDVNFSGK